MLVKVCGITNVEDARYALTGGADWIGLNFVAGPRRIDLSQGERILASLEDPAVAVLLVRLDETTGGVPGTIAELARRWGVRRLQLYGDVTPGCLGRLIRDGWEPVWVHHLSPTSTLESLGAFLDRCGRERPAWVLIDAAVAGKLCGTGRSADWKAIRDNIPSSRRAGWPALLLAGGLRPDNVAEAIATVKPAGVDVCSGVESEPGRKDPARIQAFLQAVRQASE